MKYTPAELQAEYAYRVTERLSIMLDGEWRETTPEETRIAKREALDAVAMLKAESDFEK